MNVNRIKALSAILLVTAVFSGVGIFLKSAPDADMHSESKKIPANEVYENSAESSEKYLLTVQNGKLSAYRISGASKKLINSNDIDLQLMSEEDIRILSDGIYADSFEELCLYFESYAS